jgi:hypothetical protein
MAQAASRREARATASMACVAGPIHGLRLPRHAWAGLRRHSISTLDQLRATADRLERLERIGPQTAHVIRAELARLAARPGQPSDRQGTKVVVNPKKVFMGPATLRQTSFVRVVSTGPLPCRRV